MSSDSDRVALHRALGVRLPAQRRRNVLGERLQHNEHPQAAVDLLNDRTFKLEYTGHYFDLDYYLRGVRKARRFMRGR